MATSLRSALAPKATAIMASLMSAALFFLVAGPASAQEPSDTVDLASPVKETLMDNITAALPAVAAIFGIMLAISVVLKVVKKARSA